MQKSVLKKAFTLAEVLITLGIIGIVATITIPTVIQKQQEARTVAALKKAYSTLTNAFNLAVQENGDPTMWNLVGYATIDGAVNLLNTFAPYLNISKNCGKNAGCFDSGKYIQLSKDPWTYLSRNNTASATLSDGSIIMAYIYNQNCSGDARCAAFIIDINGFKKPNQYGIDTFDFAVKKNKIVPNGFVEDSSPFSFNNYCKDKSFKGTGNPNGTGCTAWVLYNENMDYLHCSNLSWNGPTKCQ